MDNMINSKVNKQAIYEIYRACRLCGAGAGYKMPIIQNVLDIDGDEVELRQKIRECVQIEVNQDDKMPPLICELCVDKVNDFYEFMEMCRQINKRTRQTLGLPLQTTKKGTNDGGDCILGVTEPVYITKKEEEPRSSPRHAKSKTSKDTKPTVKVKLEVKTKESKDSNTRSSRSHRGRSPSPRATRKSRSSLDDNMSLSSLKVPNNQSKKLKPPSPKVTPPQPKSILRKPVKTETSPTLRSKRLREPPKPEIPQKKVKLSVKPIVKSPPKPPPKAPEFSCVVCKQKHKSSQALSNHYRVHLPNFTLSKQACNSCGEWFESVEAALYHHKRHRSKPTAYRCRGCGGSYKTLQAYDEHASTECVPWVEVPDVKCGDCWRTFPTDNLRAQHRCLGEDGRPGGKCNKCKRQYSLLKNLLKHEATCTVKRRVNFKIDPELMKKVKPIQILVSKCDPLLERTSADHYDVSAVPEYYGLHSEHKYPYLRSRLHPNSMVSIKTELDDFYCEEDYVHWDSDVTDDNVTDGPTDRKVNSLSTLALKTLFSQKCLGRVPRKRRKVKTEKSAYDTEFDELNKDTDGINIDFDDMSKNIDSIIDNLNDGDYKKDDIQNVSYSLLDDSEANIDSVSDNLSKDPINDHIDSVVDKFDINEQKLISNDDSVSESVAGSNISVSEGLEKRDLENSEQESMEVDAIDDPTTKAGDGEIKDDKEMDTDENDGSVKNDSDGNITNDISADKKYLNDDENMKGNGTVNDDVKSKDDDNVNNDCDKIEKEENVNKNEVEKYAKKADIDLNHKDNGEKMKHDENINDDDKNKDDLNVNGDNKETKKDEKEDNENCLDSVSEKPLINNQNNDSNVKFDKHVISADFCKSYETEGKVESINNRGTHENSKVNDYKELASDSKKEEDKSNVTQKNEEDSININGDVEEKSDKLNMDDFVGTDTEIDDNKLMEALDEHIGENDKKNVKINNYDDVENPNSKITLEDLIPNKASDNKSMDLDSISDDDFNFD